MKRNCTFEKGFNQHLVHVKEWIFARGYPEKWLKTTKTSNFWKNKIWEDSTKGVLFVDTFHPKLNVFMQEDYRAL